MKKNWQRIQFNLNQGIPLVYALFCSFWLLRIYEFISYSIHSQEDGIKISYFFGGTLIDLILSNLIVFISIFIQSLFFIRRIKSSILLKLVSLIFLVANYILIQVFLATKQPLDEILFHFSWNEIQTIAGTGSIKFSVFCELFIIIIFYLFLSNYFKSIKGTRVSQFFGNIIIFTSICLMPLTSYSSSKPMAVKLVNNKLSYFGFKTINYFSRKSEKSENYSTLGVVENEFLGGSIEDDNFPLMHEFISDKKFSNLFKRGNPKPPNIVFIIVESLTTNLVGKYAHTTSNLMPFLDSLARQGLYFPNTIATSERTYNVLPALLSSTPNAPENSIFMQLELPRHLSLIGILKEYYFSRFYCGHNLDFHGMRNYLNYQGINYLVNSWEKQFNNSLIKENPWGYPDGDLFAKALLDDKKINTHEKPKLDIFLTVSTHHPYVIPNQKHIIRQIKREILSEKKCSQYENYILKNLEAFSCFRYTDLVIREYFRRRKNRHDFSNTIFIITGDHGNELINENPLHKFTVPLIIVSDLIRKPQKFENIVSHLDITPSILSLLKLKYNLKVPDRVPFMSSGLSLNKKWTTDLHQVISSSSYQNIFMVYEDFFLYYDELYRIKNNLTLSPVHSQKWKRKLKTKIRNYSQFTSFCIKNDKIVNTEYFVNESINENYLLQDYEFREEIKSKNEFISFSNEIKFEKNFKRLKFIIELEYYVNSDTKLNELPKYTFSVEHSDTTLLWSQIDFQLNQVLKVNAWNKFKLVFNLDKKDLCNRTFASVNHYIWNKNRLGFHAKNVSVQVQVQKNKVPTLKSR